MRNLITVRDVTGVPYLLECRAGETLADAMAFGERFFNTEMHIIEDIVAID